MPIRREPVKRTTSQIENRNFLSPNGFRFSIRRSPQVAFFCNQANIPNMTLGVTIQPNYLRPIPVPGDTIEFGDLQLRFMVDEDLGNYMEIQKWIRGLGFPESMQEFRNLESDATLPNLGYTDQGDDIYSDGTLQILSNNLIPQFNVNFKDTIRYFFHLPCLLYFLKLRFSDLFMLFLCILILFLGLGLGTK